MIERFQQFITDNRLFFPSSKILLAVSGGIDSIVLLYLLKEAGYHTEVAHVNFQLRGDASDQDEQLVRDTCLQLGIACHIQHFETSKIALENQESIQITARKLRYQWFSQLKVEQGLHLIATAHHLNDSVETILYNLTKGTGIEGLHGIMPFKEGIVRPLLFATRAEIEKYALEKGIQWREDASNASNKYARNLIRNKVIPLLKEINPSIEKTFERNTKKLTGIENWLMQEMESIKKEKTFLQGIYWHIDLSIKNHPQGTVQLYYLLKTHGFTWEQCEDMVAPGHETGTQWASSKGYECHLDRTHWVVIPTPDLQDRATVVTCLTNSASCQTPWGKFSLQQVATSDQAYKVKKLFTLAAFDADKLPDPDKLTIRLWKDGDKFKPFGMKGKQKLVSNFLKDSKVPSWLKENVPVLCSGEEIIWVIGYRTAEPVKIDPSSKNIIEIQYLK